ncbi:hypothetical protein DBR46_09925 [Pseudomonas sp. KBW05]|nr:hypothetical protein DBR46_09925 [Pseudomonas sp. KBW05]
MGKLREAVMGAGRKVAQIQCGSGLARECGASVNECVADTPHSRASPLPHRPASHETLVQA